MNKRCLQYDSIRMWCTFFIVLCHINAYITEHKIGDGRELFLLELKSGDTTAMAVSVFFILSGASLMSVWGTKNDFNLLLYYKKRMVSIYPIFYISYICVYMYYFVTGNLMRHFSTVPKISMIFTVLGIDGYISEVLGDNFYLIGEWFLGSIIIIYICFPALLFAIRKNKMLFGIILLFSYFVGVNSGICGFNPYTFPLTRTLEFGLGMLFTEYKDSINSFVKKTIIILGVIVLCVFRFCQINTFYMHIYIVLGMSGFIVMYAVSTYAVKIRAYSMLCYNFAKVSFGTYLIHHHVLAIVASKYFGYPLLRRQMYAMLAICICLSVILGTTITKATAITMDKTLRLVLSNQSREDWS